MLDVDPARLARGGGDRKLLRDVVVTHDLPQAARGRTARAYRQAQVTAASRTSGSPATGSGQGMLVDAAFASARRGGAGLAAEAGGVRAAA